jgi:hypothetical protein
MKMEEISGRNSRLKEADKTWFKFQAIGPRDEDLHEL